MVFQSIVDKTTFSWYLENDLSYWLQMWKHKFSKTKEMTSKIFPSGHCVFRWWKFWKMNLVSEVSTKPEIGFLNNPENLNFENFEDISEFLKECSWYQLKQSIETWIDVFWSCQKKKYILVNPML